MISSAVWIQLHERDGQTDRRTLDDNIDRAVRVRVRVASRGKIFSKEGVGLTLENLFSVSEF